MLLNFMLIHFYHVNEILHSISHFVFAAYFTLNSNLWIARLSCILRTNMTSFCTRNLKVILCETTVILMKLDTYMHVHGITSQKGIN